MECLFVFRKRNQLEQSPEWEEIPSTNEIKMFNLYDPLFDRVKRVRELLETGPVGSALGFLDVDIDRVAKVTCPFYEHKGHLCVASEGHDIAPHDLDQVFDDLCGRVTFGGGLGECSEHGYRYSRGGTRARGACAARLNERLGGGGTRRSGTRRSGWGCFTIRHLHVVVGGEGTARWGERVRGLLS
jgi:hypothetical protein